MEGHIYIYTYPRNSARGNFLFAAVSRRHADCRGIRHLSIPLLILPSFLPFLSLSSSPSYRLSKHSRMDIYIYIYLSLSPLFSCVLEHRSNATLGTLQSGENALAPPSLSSISPSILPIALLNDFSVPSV